MAPVALAPRRRKSQKEWTPWPSPLQLPDPGVNEMLQSAIGAPRAAAQNFLRLLFWPRPLPFYDGSPESIGLFPSELPCRASQLIRETRPCGRWESIRPGAHTSARVSPEVARRTGQLRNMYLKRPIWAPVAGARSDPLRAFRRAPLPVQLNRQVSFFLPLEGVPTVR